MKLTDFLQALLGQRKVVLLGTATAMRGTKWRGLHSWVEFLEILDFNNNERWWWVDNARIEENFLLLRSEISFAPAPAS